MFTVDPPLRVKMQAPDCAIVTLQMLLTHDVPCVCDWRLRLPGPGMRRNRSREAGTTARRTVTPRASLRNNKPVSLHDCSAVTYRCTRWVSRCNCCVIRHTHVRLCRARLALQVKVTGRGVRSPCAAGSAGGVQREVHLPAGWRQGASEVEGGQEHLLRGGASTLTLSSYTPAAAIVRIRRTQGGVAMQQHALMGTRCYPSIINDRCSTSRQW